MIDVLPPPTDPTKTTLNRIIVIYHYNIYTRHGIFSNPLEIFAARRLYVGVIFVLGLLTIRLCSQWIINPNTENIKTHRLPIIVTSKITDGPGNAYSPVVDTVLFIVV